MPYFERIFKPGCFSVLILIVSKYCVMQEVKLRATKYLPDIIQLQQRLFKKYNYKVDEEDVSQMTVKDIMLNRKL